MKPVLFFLKSVAILIALAGGLLFILRLPGHLRKPTAAVPLSSGTGDNRAVTYTTSEHANTAGGSGGGDNTAMGPPATDLPVHHTFRLKEKKAPVVGNFVVTGGPQGKRITTKMLCDSTGDLVRAPIQVSNCHMERGSVEDVINIILKSWYKTASEGNRCGGMGPWIIDEQYHAIGRFPNPPCPVSSTTSH